MTRALKIAVIGNSVGLRVRPPQPYPENKTYSQLLRHELIAQSYDGTQVENFCIGRSTVREVLELGDNIIQSLPDVFIVNVGISDCSTREIPLWFSNIIYSSRTGFFRNIAAAIHKFLIVPNRKFFVVLRGKRSWVRPNKFRFFYTKLLKDILKNTNALVILMKINDSTERVENQLPGTRANIISFNRIIDELVELAPERIRLIETGDLDPETDLPDGIHYSRQGHDKITARLMRIIQDIES